jgi:hypothetical protein
MLRPEKFAQIEKTFLHRTTKFKSINSESFVGSFENTGADHNVLLYSRNTNASIVLTPQRDLRVVDEQQSADHVPISRVARSAYRGIRSFTVSATLRPSLRDRRGSLLGESVE